MRAPPPVEFPLRGANSGLVCAAVVFMVAAACGTIVLVTAAVIDPLAISLAFASASVLAVLLFRHGCARWSWHRASSLRWTGRVWSLCTDGVEQSPTAVRVRLDLGRWLLLELTGALPLPGRSGACWLLLPESDEPTRWHTLRVALKHACPAGEGVI